ncbi:hypothetical protein JW935_27740 [candidate division KSB1 bacterium]|nr:hypothetical protein [candidate division KSB1 bacterium]
MKKKIKSVPEKVKSDKPKRRPVQKDIKALLKDYVTTGHFKAIYLFSDDGLLLVKHVGKRSFDELVATEISVRILEIRQTLENMPALSGIFEVMLERQNGEKLVFRFVNIFSRLMILTVLVPVRKSYRGVLNKLQSDIEKSSII